MNGIHEVRGSIPLSSTIFSFAQVGEVCKAMRLAGLRSLLFWVAMVLMAGAGAGCDNPFDPLKTSDKIQGLAYFDFSADQKHWDSDPEFDGLEISLNYYNEFGEGLNFHDKPHKVTIEFYLEKAGPTPTDPVTRGGLLTSKTVEFSNSDDFIRIPIEYYSSALSLGTEAISGFLLVRLFPPQEFPQKELVYVQGEVPFYTPETVSP